MFNHKNATDLSKGSLSNVDFLILFLHFNGPSRHNTARRALLTWHGLALNSQTRGKYTYYLSLHHEHSGSGKLSQCEGYAGNSFINTNKRHYFYKTNNHWHLTISGLERLARVLSTLS